jgi:hypothetical protein
MIDGILNKFEISRSQTRVTLNKFYWGLPILLTQTNVGSSRGTPIIRNL